MARTRTKSSAAIQEPPIQAILNQEPSPTMATEAPSAQNLTNNYGQTSASNRFCPLDNMDRPTLEDADNNPYFLGTGDHPGLILASPPLTDKNFQQWHRDFNISIGAKNKSAFLNGTLPRPLPTDPFFSSWQRCNQMIMSWIIHSVSPNLKSSIKFLDTAAEMWAELNNLFDQGNNLEFFSYGRPSFVFIRVIILSALTSQN
ncbi:uncharacterized protein LOC133823554 [Humulus lupulus]|uniref:uncharacterized protein LOC133823554 n=1 Tax=Humulus lupulus TaxID=3486 RepID=UPI002B40BB92|nr:uncharacterized protein LOC133823554 [Humulus lupulus]